MKFTIFIINVFFSLIIIFSFQMCEKDSSTNDNEKTNSHLSANLFYEDTNATDIKISIGDSVYIEAYGDAFEEKINLAKLYINNDNSNEKILLFSDSLINTSFYKKTHYLIDSSKYSEQGEYTLKFIIYGSLQTQVSDELSLAIENASN